jgi:hypothetical protein
MPSSHFFDHSHTPSHPTHPFVASPAQTGQSVSLFGSTKGRRVSSPHFPTPHVGLAHLTDHQPSSRTLSLTAPYLLPDCIISGILHIEETEAASDPLRVANESSILQYFEWTSPENQLIYLSDPAVAFREPLLHAHMLFLITGNCGEDISMDCATLYFEPMERTTEPSPTSPSPMCLLPETYGELKSSVSTVYTNLLPRDVIWDFAAEGGTSHLN